MLRFNHIFTLLLILAGIGAFVVPGGGADGVRAAVAGAFAPVAWPTRVVAGWVHEKLNGRRSIDDAAFAGGTPRGMEALRTENEALRLEVASLSSQLEGLKRLNADRQMLGDVRPLCEPFTVVGADSGRRQSLILQTLGRGVVREGQPVLYSGGIVGRIERTGVGSALVRLVTDRDFRVSVGFGRFKRQEAGHVGFEKLPMSNSQPPLLIGRGDGTMHVENINLKDAQANNLKPGDWVVLEDAEWPPQLQGYKLGQVVSVNSRPKAPLFADIEIRPMQNLMQLKEVMVMNK